MRFLLLAAALFLQSPAQAQNIVQNLGNGISSLFQTIAAPFTASTAIPTYAHAPLNPSYQIHLAPGSQSPSLGTIGQNSNSRNPLQLTGPRQGNWLQVRTSDGRYGWISASAFNRVSPSSTQVAHAKPVMKSQDSLPASGDVPAAATTKPSKKDETKECASNIDEFRKSTDLKKALGDGYNPFTGWKGHKKISVFDAKLALLPDGNHGFTLDTPRGKFPAFVEVCVERPAMKPFLVVNGERREFTDQAGNSFDLCGEGHCIPMTNLNSAGAAAIN